MSDIPQLERMWVNQPSVHQLSHKYHGQNVIAYEIPYCDRYVLRNRNGEEILIDYVMALLGTTDKYVPVSSEALARGWKTKREEKK